MIKIIMLADFPLVGTGIHTTADSLFRNVDTATYEVYSSEVLSVGLNNSLPLTELHVNNNEKIIIFSHFECFPLKAFIKKFPNAAVHVGDWPGRYWASVRRNGRFVKGVLGALRLAIRCLTICKSTVWLFVTQEDTHAAIRAGYKNSRLLCLGINPPSIKRSKLLVENEIVFTGNFRYEPNYIAALELIDFVKQNPGIVVHLAGYHADIFNSESEDNIVCHSNVDSIVNFLAAERRVYVSLIRIGAGAKNKILEALVAGCPIVATEESLDRSLGTPTTVYVVTPNASIVELIKIASDHDYKTHEALEVAKTTENERSWTSVTSRLMDIINER